MIRCANQETCKEYQKYSEKLEHKDPYVLKADKHLEGGDVVSNEYYCAALGEPIGRFFCSEVRTLNLLELMSAELGVGLGMEGKK